MIKKFKDYINEELKADTYKSAAKKLKELGGAHEKRGKNLLDWVDTIDKRKLLEKGKSYGDFYMNYQVISGVAKYKNSNLRITTEREFTEIFHKKYQYNKGLDTIISSIKEAPNKCYISSMACDEFEEYPTEEIYGLDKIHIIVFIIDIESGAQTHAFTYEIPITWLNDNTFKLIDDINIGSGWNADESKILFSDRLNAVKFKKMMTRDNIINLLNCCETGGMYPFGSMSASEVEPTVSQYENYYDVLRNFFMEYSTAEEMEKIFKLIESVPINKLWN